MKVSVAMVVPTARLVSVAINCMLPPVTLTGFSGSLNVTTTDDVGATLFALLGGSIPTTSGGVASRRRRGIVAVDVPSAIGVSGITAPTVTSSGPSMERVTRVLLTGTPWNA